MENAYQVNAGWIAFAFVAFLGDIIGPLLLGLWIARKLQVKWRYFGYGAAIFFLFQLVTRVPLQLAAGILLGPVLATSLWLQLAWGAFSALTAGLAEEIGRYVGYRWFMGREVKTWAKGVMYGAGHGGFEAIAFIGLFALGSTLINILAWPIVGPTLEPNVQVLLKQQVAAINAQPIWTPLLGFWERGAAIAAHISLSVVVLQAFRRNQMRWLWYGVALHTLLDLMPSLPVMLALANIRLYEVAQNLLIEGLLTVYAVFSVWLIFRLRTPDEVVTPPEVPPLSPVLPPSA